MSTEIRTPASIALSGLYSAAAARENEVPKDTILCVEDCRLIRETLGELLPYLIPGFEIEFAVDGDDAIEKLSVDLADRVALVLADVEMPNKTGLELAKYLKANETLAKKTPVLIMSGSSKDYTMPGTEQYETYEKLKMDGIVDGLVEKPIDTELFQRVILRAVMQVREKLKKEAVVVA